MVIRDISRHKLKEGEIYSAYKIFFGTLASESRLRIINLLRQGKKYNVSQISKELEMGQTTVSHNLQRLKSCGFVVSEVDKKFRYYSLNKKTIKPLMNLIDRHMSLHCVHILRNKNEEMKK